MPKAALSSYRFDEPINKVSAVVLGKPVVIECPLGKTICYVNLGVNVTASATGAATKTIPRPSWGANEIRFKLGNVNRVRTAAQLFGAFGLLSAIAHNDMLGGSVQYYQAGALITVAYNGRTIGNEPVAIDSAEDVALQAALANNTATEARFTLPIPFAEDYRKNPAWAGEGMALPTGFDNGTVLGTPYVEIDIPAATGVAGTMTAVTLDANLVYTEDLAKAGSVVNMSKWKIHQKIYAVGNIELGDQFETKDVLQRFSLLTLTDKITRVVVKQGSRIVRDVSFAKNQITASVAEINGKRFIANRFDVDLDINDDPTTALPLNRLAPLSVVATFATANDNPLNCLILADYYGPVE